MSNVESVQNGRKPNVVFIIADDHRGESLGTSASAIVRTPVLDRLAAEGTAFSNTHIFGGLTGAVCAPSRACVNSGKSVFNAMTGKDVMSWEHAITIRSDVKLMPQAMREAGYRTHAVGKWHNDKPSFARSFEGGDKLFFHGMSDHTEVPVQDFDPTGQYPQEREYIERTFSTELFTNAAVDFIDQYAEEEPFYLYVAYTAPHDPRTAPDDYRSMYVDEDIPLPANFMEQHPFDTGDMNVRDEKLAALPREAGEIRRHIADYYALITHLDAEIGRVIDALKAKGIYEDTIIVYTADHGLSVGQHGLMGKQNVYEHSVRIPFILRGPSVPAGGCKAAPVSNIDIFPTLASLCEIPLPDEVEGVSMLPVLKGETDRVRHVVCSAYRDVQRMVTDGRWKLIRYYYSPATETGVDRIQLFDLQNDPWETADLSGDPQHHEVLLQLAGELAEWMHEYGDILTETPVLPTS
ncbi:sulfatase-like hydrolase/transferase [Paenibacillus sp. J5C_2022]|uniref:sulfatase-like hydrolase/transferase n=1 Tax=Paenibacillus sp. J5C2022 TaxID=2977129 RepID=UPI0021D11B57|nr:sulfatase-like hydrolase/transferase [Paenibacillus sp. J5C2022]MCU6713138.1 sulfatase-like hydrolase/transferase [Paenibacillus sp. J5C2022]